MDNRADELCEAMTALDEDRVLALAKQLSDEGYAYHDVLLKLNEGVKRVGDMFADGDYFIGDLIVSGMIYRAAISMFIPDSENFSSVPSGKLVIGVVEHDIRDIGKDIVVSILRASGYEVIDLGIDVKPERFLYAVKTYEPDILLLSGMMRFSQTSMEVTIRHLREAGLRDHVRIIVGGGCVTDTLKDLIGADGSAYDPMDTLAMCDQMIKGFSHE